MKKSQEELRRDLMDSTSGVTCNYNFQRHTMEVRAINLWSTNTEHLTGLPDNLTVRGFAFLSTSSVTRLPKNFTVEGNLHLNSFIRTIPNCTKVGGKVYLDLHEFRFSFCSFPFSNLQLNKIIE